MPTSRLYCKNNRIVLTELGYAIRKHIKMSMFSVFRGYTLLTSMGMFGDNSNVAVDLWFRSVDYCKTSDGPVSSQE